jgi:hypothetical protein
MFKPQFAPLVESGGKRQTIRPIPKRMPKAGDKESWRQWTGLPYRSKTRELARVDLILVAPITLERIKSGTRITIHAPIPAESSELFAAQDGFSSTMEMFDWFEKNHGLPFTGILIRSKSFQPNHLTK